jgi:uncharacterized protein (TIGR00296 family)
MKIKSEDDEDEGDKKGYELRGCIGTFDAIKLREGLKKYVNFSAFKDSRFEPLKKEEFPFIDIEISLLNNFEDIGNKWKNWIIGTHGISIDFRYDGDSYHATYLPEVSLENKWDHEKTVKSLIRKSGFKGNIDTTLLNSLKIKRYKTSEFSMTYDDYIKLGEKKS